MTIVTVVCLATLATLVGTTVRGEDAPGPSSHSWVSGCLSRRAGGPGVGAAGCEQIEITGGPGTVAMTHLGAMLNCCTDVSIATVVDGASIRFLERETGEVCRCLCPYNLTAEVGELAAGTYHVELCGSADELLWVQFVEVFPSPSRVSFGFTPCPPDLPVEEPPPASVEIASCAGTITVHHLSARVNCCIDLEVELAESSDRIVLTEKDVGQPCYCICATDIMIAVRDVAAGRYVVDLVDVTGALAGSAVVDVTGPRPAFRHAGAPR